MKNKFFKIINERRFIILILILLGVILIVRGSFGIIDVYLFKNNFKLSSWIYFIIGGLLLWCVLTWFTYPVSKASKKIKKSRKKHNTGLWPLFPGMLKPR